MWIHQELRDFPPIESRFPCDCREGWSAVRATFLIVGDDVTGRAPVPSEFSPRAGWAGIAAALVIEAHTPRANAA
jgi:DMSO/TMAO reductase YedYZ molybdopterin-dependent catalytic subunit